MKYVSLLIFYDFYNESPKVPTFVNYHPLALLWRRTPYVDTIIYSGYLFSYLGIYVPLTKPSFGIIDLNWDAFWIFNGFFDVIVFWGWGLFSGRRYALDCFFWGVWFFSADVLLFSYFLLPDELLFLILKIFNLLSVGLVPFF